METEKFDATVWDSEDEIQPEGGLDLDDLSEDEQFSAIDGDGTGTEVDQLDTENSEPENQNGDEADPAPTTEQPAESADGDGTKATPTTEEPKQPEQTKLRFKAKIDRKDEDIELDSSELPALYQKGRNYDRMERKFNAQSEKMKSMEVLASQLGYKSIDDMIEKAGASDREARIKELTDAGTALSIAEDFVDRSIEKMRQTKAAEEPDKGATAPEESVPDAKETPNTAPDFKKQVEDLFRVRPDLRGTLKQLPEEVSKAVVEGGLELRTAYAEWEARQMKAENEKIRREKDLFAQQAETASRAPVRGATDTKVEEKDKPDPFVKAFWDEIY